MGACLAKMDIWHFRFGATVVGKGGVPVLFFSALVRTEEKIRNPKSTATAAYMGVPTGLWRLEVLAKSIRAACVERSWRLVNVALFSTGVTHANFVVHGGFGAP